jgi:EAL domain-containing protein (putative c-di-GMP-specific phosphodiesterase class I)
VASDDSNTGLEWQDADWTAALRSVIDDPHPIELLFQPIIDLRRGIVGGYETLARFPGANALGPDRWFEAARRLGLSAKLESILIGKALDARDGLPAGGFLALNVRPEDLGSPEVQDTIAAAGDLTNAIFELTDHTTMSNAQINDSTEVIKERGGRIAIDDIGASYSGISRINRLRPDFLKIDHHLIAGIEDDPEKLELIESLVAVARRVGAVVIAEGVETLGELDAMLGLGLPLAQGFGLGRPAAAMEGINPVISKHIRESQVFQAQHEDFSEMVVPVLPFVESAGTARLEERFAEEPGRLHLVVVDDLERPVSLATRPSKEKPTSFSVPLIVSFGSNFPQVARLAMTRPPEHRFDPLVFCDELGRYVGLIAMENVVEALAVSAP